MRKKVKTIKLIFEISNHKKRQIFSFGITQLCNRPVGALFTCNNWLILYLNWLLIHGLFQPWFFSSRYIKRKYCFFESYKLFRMLMIIHIVWLSLIFITRWCTHARSAPFPGLQRGSSTTKVLRYHHCWCAWWKTGVIEWRRRRWRKTERDEGLIDDHV